MEGKIKKIFLTFIPLTVVAIIAIVGYIFINSQSKKELGNLEKEMSIIASPSPSPSPSPLAKRAIFFSQPEAEKKALLFLKTDKKTYLQGESFSLEALLKAFQEIVDGVEFVLSYNPDKVEIGQPIKGSFFSLYPQLKVDSQEKTVKVIALQKPEESKAVDQETVVILPVKVLKKGEVVFAFVEEKSHLAAYGGQDLLKKAIPLTIKIE